MPEDRNVCRDFERGVCNRGENCRYYHPDGVVPAEGAKLPICKDFQNKGCSRFKCKFLHVTVEEEVVYNSTGCLPEHGGHPEKVSNVSLSNKDICRDFLNGRCDRGSRCKYSHDHEEDHGPPMGGMYGKRPRNDDLYGSVRPNDGMLLDENEYLRRKVADLQKEATELRQMNDTLYEQNSRYRSQLDKSRGTNTASQISAYTPVVYPHYSQTAYPTKAAAMPIASATTVAGINPYSYQQY